MPVDKFGRGDTHYTEGLSLSYIARNFQRKGEISDEMKAYLQTAGAGPPKPIFTVWAVAKGTLLPGSPVFSFGHRESDYVALANGRILRLGVLAHFKRDVESDVIIHVTVNGNPTNGYGCTQAAASQSGVEIFDTPLEFRQGDVINFMCVNGNADTKSTLASALIEIDL